MMHPSDYAFFVGCGICSLMAILCMLSAAGTSFDAVRHRAPGLGYWEVMEAMKSFKSLRSYEWMRDMFTEEGWIKAKRARRLQCQMLGFAAAFAGFATLGAILGRLGY